MFTKDVCHVNGMKVDLSSFGTLEVFTSRTCLMQHKHESIVENILADQHTCTTFYSLVNINLTPVALGRLG